MGNKENKMFCFQCQETAGCSGCTVSGVCGKKPDSGKSRSTSGSSTLERDGSGF